MDDKTKTKNPDSIYHYGVLGMRWGFRKGPNGKVVKTGRTAKGPDSKDHKRKTDLRKKSVSEMSNTELRELTTRMQLERQYGDLNKSSVSRGQKFATDIVTNSGKQLATAYAMKYGAKAVEYAIKKAVRAS